MISVSEAAAAAAEASTRARSGSLLTRTRCCEENLTAKFVQSDSDCCLQLLRTVFTHTVQKGLVRSVLNKDNHFMILP